jgi:CubicO group peptidase (beta-lactamase class C family)
MFAVIWKNSIILFFFSVLFFYSGCNKDTNSPETGEKYVKFICSGEYSGEYYPTNGWRTCRPEAVGVDSNKLKKVYEYAANDKIKTDGIIIIKDGYIIGEAYFGSNGQNIKHQIYSITKSITSLLFGIASDNSLINDLDYKIYNYFPEWQTASTDEKKKKITIRHLLTMTSGLEWIENNTDITTVTDDNTTMYKTEDFIQYVLKKNISTEPGSIWFYNNGATMLLSGIIEKVSGKSEYNYGLNNLFLPLGINSLVWESDNSGHNTGGWGIQATLRDLAKIGYLCLGKGYWGGRQIISKEWLEQSLKPVSTNVNFYGFLWWLPPYFENYQSYNIPSGTYFAFGARLQVMIIVPEKNIIAVRFADDIADPGKEWETLKFLSLILDSIK